MADLIRLNNNIFPFGGFASKTRRLANIDVNDLSLYVDSSQFMQFDFIASNCTGSKPFADYFCITFVYAIDAAPTNTYITQIAVEDGDNVSMKIRGYHNGWGSWKSITQV